MKKAVMIIAFRDFKDEEYFIPKKIIEKGGVEVKTASNKKGLAIGSDGGEANIDLELEEVNVKEFDAIIFSGGMGALENLDNNLSYKVLDQALEQNKLIAAICISPVILAKSGILKGKKATVWSSSLDKKPVRILQENGAEFVKQNVVKHENVITGSGPWAAQEFGQKILDSL
jgi:protease I